MLRSTQAKASEVETIINYTFTDKRLAAEATQMAAPVISAIYNNTFDRLNNNKRLSILGEAVLAKGLCSAWFKERTSRDGVLSPAQWTQLRDAVYRAMQHLGFFDHALLTILRVYPDSMAQGRSTFS